MATKAKDETQSDQPTTDAPTPKDNGEKRLFQLQNGNKVNLTKAEAKKQGFFWKD